MNKEYSLTILKDASPIVFRYFEVDFPISDTEVFIYDSYKLNIMLSDGLAALLSDRGDIYNTFSGDMLFFNPSEIHCGRILRQGVHKYIEILIPVEYFPEFRSYYMLFNDISDKRTNIISPPPKERTLILSVAEKIINNLKVDADNISLLAALLELIDICTSLYCNKEKNGLVQNIPATLENAVDFIRKSYSENIQITDIADAVKCSPSYLSRIFKKHFGKSPYCYLTEYRLFIAEKLLRNNYSVTEVALMSGFSDCSALIKHFKGSFGITPLKYKENYKQKS